MRGAAVLLVLLLAASPLAAAEGTRTASSAVYASTVRVATPLGWADPASLATCTGQGNQAVFEACFDVRPGETRVRLTHTESRGVPLWWYRLHVEFRGEGVGHSVTIIHSNGYPSEQLIPDGATSMRVRVVAAEACTCPGVQLAPAIAGRVVADFS